MSVKLVEWLTVALIVLPSIGIDCRRREGVRKKVFRFIQSVVHFYDVRLDMIKWFRSVKVVIVVVPRT